MDIDDINAVMDDYINCMLYEETDGAVGWVLFFANSNHFKWLQPGNQHELICNKNPEGNFRGISEKIDSIFVMYC